jgi:Nucleotide modification associated domain 3
VTEGYVTESNARGCAARTPPQRFLCSISIPLYVSDHVDMNSNVKALLLPVGLDKQSAGAYGPIFEDGSFEYIPKPADNESAARVTYNKRLGRKRLPLAVYLPRTLKNAAIDENPDFEACRYDVAPSLRVFLSPLQSGDLLVFYAGLQPFHTDVYRTGLYIIGYFTAKDVVAFRDHSQVEEPRSSNQIVHSDGKSSDTLGVTLVVGNDEYSKLLDAALPLANYVVNRDKGAGATFTSSDEMVELIGLPGTINYNSPMWIVGQEYVKNLKQKLGLL